MLVCSCVHSQNKCPAPCRLMTSSKVNLASLPPFPYSPKQKQKPAHLSLWEVASCATGSARPLQKRPSNTRAGFQASTPNASSLVVPFPRPTIATIGTKVPESYVLFFLHCARRTHCALETH